MMHHDRSSSLKKVVHLHNDKDIGFYRCHYLGKSGKHSSSITFEPLGLQRCFSTQNFPLDVLSSQNEFSFAKHWLLAKYKA